MTRPVPGHRLEDHRGQLLAADRRRGGGAADERANGRRALGLRPRARIVASAVCGDDPMLMLTGPIPATDGCWTRAGLAIDEIDAVEINEAFAPVPLAWLREFPIDPERVNPRGGAIALGHPLGASGARLLTTLLNHLEATGGRYGLQTMCEAGGMANAADRRAARLSRSPDEGDRTMDLSERLRRWSPAGRPAWAGRPRSGWPSAARTSCIVDLPASAGAERADELGGDCALRARRRHRRRRGRRGRGDRPPARPRCARSCTAPDAAAPSGCWRRTAHPGRSSCSRRCCGST